MKIGSLFTGTGALDMAARAVFGGEVIWHSDIKPAAVSLLEHRYPDTPNLGDITLIDPRDVDPVDLLTFGWPCQPHSSAGKRLGEADPRALWPEVHRLVVGLRPRILLGENVSRVASNGELRRVVRSLAEVGYVGSWRCHTAGSEGAPHRRDRLFLLAHRADAADPFGLQLRDEPGRRGGPGGQGARVAGDDGAQRSVPRLTLLPTPHQNMTTGAGTSGREGGLNLQTAVTLLPTPAVADARNTRNATAGRSEGQEHHHSGWTLSDVAYAQRWGRYAEAIARWEQIIGRPAPEPTKGLTRTGRPLLNPAFPEWMMGLPQGWVTEVPGLTRNQQLSMIGDGVVPRQAEAAYRALLGELTGERAA